MKTILGAAIALAAVALSPDVRAGCGFYTAPLTASGAALVNDADQVVLVRDGTRFALTMSTNYKGPAEDFAMIVPVPVVLKKEQVKTLSPEIFTHLEKMTAPRIVEYQEDDPCKEGKEGAQATKMAPGGAVGATGGGGGKGGYGVTVEAQFVTGEYEIVVLSAAESDGLERWLKDQKYKIPDGASAALDPYVKQQQKFVVAKVDSKKVHRDAQGAVVLSPLRFVYETQDFRLPVRLGLLNAPKGGKQDLIIYLLARGTRMETANLANVTIPTNVDVQPETIKAFAGFYASLLDATLMSAKGPAAILEYAWPAHACGSPCTDKPLDKAEIDKLGADEIMADVPASQLVLTRLHTRFDQTSLKEDIVFHAADPIAGGGEGDPGAESRAASANTFQARYAVRHAWTGPIACANPRRGNWLPKAATHQAVDLASPPRDVTLAAHVVSPIPALGIAGTSSGFGAIPTVSPPRKKAAAEDAPNEAVSKPVILTVALFLGAAAVTILVLRRKPAK